MVKLENTRKSLTMSEILREKAKKMYQHGMSVAEMAEVLEVPYAAMQCCVQDADFQAVQRAMQLRFARMKRLLLDSFDDLQAGKRPKISPSQMLQYATAYEKLSDKKRHLGCWYEAYEQLTEKLLDEAAGLVTKQARSAASSSPSYVTAADGRCLETTN